MFNQQSNWQRHFAVEQALSTYHELILKFPLAARMVASGEINLRERSEYQLSDGDDIKEILDGAFGGEPLSSEAEAENEAWRNLTRAIGAVIGQIFYATRDSASAGSHESEAMRQLRAHGDNAIAQMVGRTWKSIHRFARYECPDPDLSKMINEIIGKCELAEKEFEQSLKEPEAANA